MTLLYDYDAKIINFSRIFAMQNDWPLISRNYEPAQKKKTRSNAYPHAYNTKITNRKSMDANENNRKSKIDQRYVCLVLNMS